MTDIQISGLVAPGFEPVRDAFEENFEDGLELGAGFAAYLDGDMIIDIEAGHADRKGNTPWTPDTLVPVYSVSKGISALIVAMLVDQGKVKYDTPLAHYWPEFGAHGKNKVTVGEALSHQAGVPGFATAINPDLWIDPPALAARLAEEPPLWTPGDGSGYHPTTWGYIAGELVRRVSGRTLGTILREDICIPLGIDFHIGLAEEEHERCAELKRPTAMPDLGDVTEDAKIAFLTKWASSRAASGDWRKAEIPSANGHGTASGVARLYSAYASGGTIGEVTLFGRETWQALTKQRTLGQDRVLPFEMEFGAGIMRNNNLAFGPNRDTLGHSGWGGSAAFADPDRGLAAAYVMNKQSNILLGDPRSKRLFASLYACL